ncbi:MAG: AMP-binding protein, partial [Gammaproteobacteria bacterium]|nr:AMP-binding protein [Gammaproteobacteria bacterium]
MNSLLQKLETRACRSPESIVLETADRAVNISEFLALLQEVTFTLKAGGFQTVALYADNSPEWVVVDLACQMQGICLVPLPTFFSFPQLSHVLRSAGIDLLIYQEGLDQCIPGNVTVGGAEFS